ncbi:MAG TPA: hypothetical protein VEZ70_12970 [Allosphingosinicella sp.]|nr:hypothetical protein [Allosphingosinicella sp.]
MPLAVRHTERRDEHLSNTCWADQSRTRALCSKIFFRCFRRIRRSVSEAASGELTVPIGAELPLGLAAEAQRRLKARGTKGEMVLSFW